jgi:hypothetical protein
MTRIWRIALPAVLAHLCGRLISQTLPATLAHEASVISSWSYAICRPTTGKCLTGCKWPRFYRTPTVSIVLSM